MAAAEQAGALDAAAASTAAAQALVAAAGSLAAAAQAKALEAAVAAVSPKRGALVATEPPGSVWTTGERAPEAQAGASASRS